jgi:sulfatase modifying factor 1
MATEARVRWLVVMSVSALTACSALVDFKGLTGDGADGAARSDASTAAADGQAGGDAASPDDATTGSSDGAPPDEAGFTCPAALHGPPLVVVDSYCIDQTEVTNKQYLAFLAANVDPKTQPGFCSWNGTFAPSCGMLLSNDMPVACVDWCDAYAFCAWAGKRLCGRIGGGAVDKAGAGDPNAGQWYRACSHAGTRAFPYGNAYMPGACCDISSSMAGARTVATSSKCVGGYPGIYDMNGNVNEWEDSCTGSSGMSDQCLIRGGAFDDSFANEACAVAMNASQFRSQADPTIGIRCCAP